MRWRSGDDGDSGGGGDGLGVGSGVGGAIGGGGGAGGPEGEDVEAEGDTWDRWDGVGIGVGLGWDHRVALGGMALLDSTKKLEMIVMIIINFAIYTSTHYFSPSYAKGHRSCTHIYSRKDSWEWIESTLGYPEPPDLQPQLSPGINRPNHTQALR